jgi:hypothetical protein
MRSTVYFADLRATTKESFVDKIGRLVDTAGLSDCLKKRNLVAVKLHFGELGEDKFSGLYPKSRLEDPVGICPAPGIGPAGLSDPKNVT